MDVNTGTILEPLPASWKIWKQRRHILTFLVFLGFFSMYTLRVNLSVALIAMTQDRYEILENGTQINIGPEFKWENTIQGYILSAFFYGYIVIQPFAGFLSKKFGGKLMCGGGIGLAALSALITPWLADLSVYALLIGRACTGLFEGPIHISVYHMWSVWTPPTERARVTSQTMAGNYVGTVFSMMFNAYLAEVAGWRSIFWFSGGLGLLWFIAWWTIIADSPNKDPHISKAELQYIETSLKELQITKTIATPWKHVCISRAVWAFSAASFCEGWGYYTLITLLPKYFNDVFKFDLSQLGILSALPYICLAVMMNISGVVSDRAASWKCWSLTACRKVFAVIGFFGQISFLMGAVAWENIAGTVFCLVMAVGLSSFALSTTSVNVLDFAPQNASPVYGVGVTCVSLSGLISPTVAGYVVSTTNPTAEQWRIVFYIASGLYLTGAVIFVLFASGEREAWDFEIKSEQTDITNNSVEKYPETVSNIHL